LKAAIRKKPKRRVGTQRGDNLTGALNVRDGFSRGYLEKQGGYEGKRIARTNARGAKGGAAPNGG